MTITLPNFPTLTDDEFDLLVDQIYDLQKYLAIAEQPGAAKLRGKYFAVLPICLQIKRKREIAIATASKKPVARKS